jgi:hypothetical protein
MALAAPVTDLGTDEIVPPGEVRLDLVRVELRRNTHG